MSHVVPLSCCLLLIATQPSLHLASISPSYQELTADFEAIRQKVQENGGEVKTDQYDSLIQLKKNIYQACKNGYLKVAADENAHLDDIRVKTYVLANPQSPEEKVLSFPLPAANCPGSSESKDGDRQDGQDERGASQSQPITKKPANPNTRRSDSNSPTYQEMVAAFDAIKAVQNNGGEVKTDNENGLVQLKRDIYHACKKGYLKVAADEDAHVGDIRVKTFALAHPESREEKDLNFNLPAVHCHGPSGSSDDNMGRDAAQSQSTTEKKAIPMTKQKTPTKENAESDSRSRHHTTEKKGSSETKQSSNERQDAEFDAFIKHQYWKFDHDPNNE